MGESQQRGAADLQTPQFSGAWDLFGPSARAIGRNFWTIVGLFAIPLGGLLVMFGVLLGLGALHAPSAALGVIGVVLGLASLSAFLVVLPASTVALLHGARGKQLEIKEAVQLVRPLVWRYVGLSLATLIIYIVGILLLVIPYFFALQRFMLAPYFLLEKDMRVGESLRESARVAKRYSGAMWGVVGVVAIINLMDFVPHVGHWLAIFFSLLYAAAPVVRYIQVLDAEQNEGKKGSGKKAGRPSAFAKQFDGKSTVD